MKKKMLIGIIFCLILLTGCGTSESNSSKDISKGTLNCTKTEYDDDGYKITDTMVVKYKNNIVTSVSETNIAEVNPDYIDMTLSFGNLFAEKLSEIDGINIKYTKTNDKTLQFTIDVDYSKVELDKIKQTLGDAYDEKQASMYTKNVSLNTFKNDILSDYTCE